MAKISGITIKLDGDTKGLVSSLKSVDGALRQTQSSLKNINKLLKFDPSNTELLRQKQKYLQEAIEQTNQRLKELKKEQSQFAEGSDEWNAYQREIIDTEQQLASLEKELKQFGSVAAQQIKAAGEKMEQFGNKVSNVGQKLMPISRTAAGIGAGLLGLGYKAVTAADDLNTLSQQTGLTTEEIQKMQYASDLVDVSFEDISGALKKMKKNMTGHADTWEKLGISVTDVDGNMRSATDVFYESLEALSQIENETERDQVAMDLFGKSADQLAGIIDDGGAALKEYGDEAKNLGLIMEQDTIDSLNEMNDTLDKLKGNFKGSFAKLGASVAKAFGPALEKASGLLETFAEKIRNLTPEQTEMIAKIAGVVAAIAPLLLVGGKLISGIGKIMMLAPMISTAFSALLSPVGLIVLGIAALVAIGVVLYKNWDKIKAKAAELKDKIVNAWNNLKTKTAEAWQNMKDKISTTWENIKSSVSAKIEELKDKISNTWDNIKSAATSKVNAIKSSVVNAFNNMKTTVVNTLNNLKTAATNVWNSITSAANRVKTSLSSGWTSITTAATTAFNNLKSTVTGVFDSILSKAQTIVEKIKSLFKFKINIKGGASGASGGIQEYASAYNNPVMFTSPTVLATPSGLKQFGDGNGAEIVMGLNKLRELVGTSGDVIINVYPAQGMDVNQLADQIQDRFVALQKQRSLAYA